MVKAKKKKMKDERFIVVHVSMNSSYGRQVLRGICKYFQPDRTWQILDVHSFDVGETQFIDTDALGIITMHRPLEYIKIARRYGKAVVSVGEQIPGVKSPMTRHVGVSIKALGEMAVEHFLDRGFRNFGTIASEEIGPRIFSHSDYRGVGFEGALRRRKIICHTFDSGKGYFREGEPLPPVSTSLIIEHAHRWLVGLPKPVAVFCFDDYAGACLSDLCRRCGIHIPEEVAILCVDNGIYCDLASPNLSSIAIPGEQIGHEAARMLDDVIRRPKAVRGPVLLKPIGVVTRQSTDVMAIEDRYVVEAVRFIRENAHHGIRVEDVLERARMSRRMLERRFKATLGRSPFAEIRRIQIERIKVILAQTNKTLETIASECGFESITRMTLAFKRAMKMPPGAYRRQFQKQ